MNNILILGCRNSGTTLLATILGTHPLISVLNEPHSRCWEKQVGKPFRAIKLVIPHAKWNRRSTLLSELLYTKLAFLFDLLKLIGIKIDLTRPAPYSIKEASKADYVIIINRDYNSNIQSIVTRGKLYPRRARRCLKIFYDTVLKIGRPTHIVHFSELTDNPQRVMSRIARYLHISDTFIFNGSLNNTYKQEQITPKA